MSQDKSNMNSNLKEFYNNDLFSDVTLVLFAGKKIQAHKVVLAEKSPYFNDLFNNDPTKNVYEISDYDIQVVEDIIKHFYGYDLNVNGTNAYNTKKFIAAGKLKYDALMKHYANLIPVDSANVLDILSLVKDKEDFKKLKTKCFDVIESNFQQLFEQDKWKSFLETSSDSLKSWLLDLQVGITFYKSNYGMITAPKKVETKVNVFARSLANHAFSDVILESKEGQTIEAHKIILSSASNIFKIMLTSDTLESKENRVIFKEMDFEVLEQFIKFIYSGQVDENVIKSIALDLIFVAERYQLKTLTKICEFYIFDNISHENVLEILDVVANFDFIDPILKEKCKECIELSIEKMFEKPEWGSFVAKNTKIINEIIAEMINFKNVEIWSLDNFGSCENQNDYD